MDVRVKSNRRKECIITGSQDLKSLYTFKNFPLHIGCTDNPNPKSDLHFDMEWAISESSGQVQLLNLVDPTILYNRNHGSGTIGKIWEQHHKKFAEFISAHSHNKVLEIGGSTGSLVKHFLETDKKFEWTIIEPTLIQPVNDQRLKYINGFLEHLTNTDKFDTIIHSHVFEHSYDPIEFLLKIHQCLTDNGNHFISIPNMKAWLEQGGTNTLSFEHTFYIDAIVIEYLLNKTNFKIIDMIVEDHSIFIHCQKSIEQDLEFRKFDHVKNVFLSYVSNLQKDFENILDKIQNQKVYLFGGHIFSQVLLSLGLKEDQIIAVLDNDKNKQGKRLYGSSLYVQSPQTIEQDECPIVIVRGGVYTNEIVESLLKVNPKTRIV